MADPMASIPSAGRLKGDFAPRAAPTDKAYAETRRFTVTEIPVVDDRDLVLALPKGRILKDAVPLLARAGIVPESAFNDENSRLLQFSTNVPGFSIIRTRSFDVATFVAFGAAHLGIAGSDVLMEFDYPENYAPLDLGIGKCRMVVAEPQEMVAGDDPSRWSHVSVATKYPDVTRKHFAARGVQAEIQR